MINEAFTDSELHYYNRDKKIICSYIPAGDNVILDLGCGSGRIGQTLVESGKVKEIVGVEIFEGAAKEAEKHYSKVYTGNAEELSISYDKYFDYIICGDILEHLVDPWTMLLKLHAWLKDQGKIIISIPNIRFFRILKDLLFLGKWEYRDAGILDRTHLRFFTRSSFSKVLGDTNFEIVKIQPVIQGNKKKAFNTMTCGIFKDFLCSQFLFIGQKKLK